MFSNQVVTYLDNVGKFWTEADFAMDQESYSMKYQFIIS